ncbi:MAG: MFS transporter [Deltaproteobacteria bacterium]|nr:MFS transporter [Deltaproteobacteria bacterium]MBW2132964.1 MFS transporter [Deltaproteobacteria bacterium]
MITGKKTFYGISSFEMLAMFRRGLFYAYLSIYLRHFLGLSVTETTLFATLPMIANVLCQTFLWGPISDRFQLRRTLIVWGEFLAAFGTALVWVAHRFPDSPGGAGYAVIFGLTLVEIFWSMSNVGWSALISDLYPLKERNAVQGKLASLGGLGRMIGIWIGGVLYDGMGLRYDGWGFHEGWLFFVASTVMLLSILPLRWVPEGGVGKRFSHADPVERDPDPSDAVVFFIFIAAMVFINFGRNSIMVIQTQYLVMETAFGVSSRELSHIVNMQSAAIIVTGFSAGWLGRRIGDRHALITGTLLAIVSLVLLSATMDLKLIYLSNFLKGVSDVIIMASAYAVASSLIAAKTRGRFFGIFNATFFLSWGLAGTLIVGPAADLLMIRGIPEVLSYRISFVLAAGVTFLGLVLMIFLISSKRFTPKASRSMVRAASP